MSEGQAYALLLAVATSDRARFDAVWTWTRSHLQEGDGLFAWRWSGGRVSDPQSASDADVMVAWALALGSEQFGATRYRADAARIADAVLANESVPTPAGRVLVAGPWARNPVPIVNPSYFIPAAFAKLRAVTRDPRWDAVAGGTQRIVDELTARSLPPDWAELTSAGDAVPRAAPDGTPPQFGFDAVRVPMFQSDNGPVGLRATRSKWSALLADKEPARACRLPRALDGANVRATSESAVACVATAEAAGAAGDAATGGRLLAYAHQLAAKHPTYYADALIALASALPTLETRS